jgi:hypothetical protein
MSMSGTTRVLAIHHSFGPMIAKLDDDIEISQTQHSFRRVEHPIDQVRFRYSNAKVNVTKRTNHGRPGVRSLITINSIPPSLASTLSSSASVNSAIIVEFLVSHKARPSTFSVVFKW